MNKKTLIAAGLSLAMMVTPALAFYNNSSGDWSVFGHSGSDTLNPACVMKSTWQDGSKMLVIQDLADGELYIHFENMGWNIDGPYNTSHAMKINFYSGSSVLSLNGTMELLTKNSIHIRGIKHNVFVEPFAEFDKMVFIMPGTVPNANIGLRGTRDAVNFLNQCMRDATKINLTYPKKGQSL